MIMNNVDKFKSILEAYEYGDKVSARKAMKNLSPLEAVQFGFFWGDRANSPLKRMAAIEDLYEWILEDREKGI